METRDELPSAESVRVESNNGVAGVFAGRDYRRGERLIPLEGRSPARRTRYSIQIGVDLHLDPESLPNGAPGATAPWKYLNHACDPNLAIDLDAMCFTARRDIAAGEELTFNYLTTEWEMASEFDCLCGSDRCFGTIQGFAHLRPEEQAALLPSAAAHIRTLYDRSRAAHLEKSGK